MWRRECCLELSIREISVVLSSEVTKTLIVLIRVVVVLSLFTSLDVIVF